MGASEGTPRGATAGGEWTAVARLTLLGPVEVRHDGNAVALGSPRAAALLVRLLLDHGRPVPAARLLEDVWPDRAEGGDATLRPALSRLRKRLRDGGIERDLIETAPSGYRLDPGALEIDSVEFERLARDARVRADGGDPGAARALAEQALALWRGPALADLDDLPFARLEGSRLDELRLAALEVRVDADLALGRHRELIGELEGLTARHPLRERFWAQRVLALYRSRRQAEALRVFQDLRRTLAEELGVAPSEDVARLERGILDQDPSLELPTSAVPRPEGEQDAESAAPATPAIRPGRVSAPAPAFPTYDGPFVGREAELARLRSWWEGAAHGPAQLLLLAGEAGVGKTRLAATLAANVVDDGAVVLWGRCDQEPVIPYQPFAEALAQYLARSESLDLSSIPSWRLAELARLVPDLARRAPAPERAEVSDADTDRYRFFEAVASTLIEIAAQSPVAIVIDDLHWADRATLLLLRHVMRAGAAHGPGFIGLYNPAEVPAEHPLTTLVTEIQRERPPARLAVGGLDASAVEDLVALAGSGDHRVALRLYELTDGHPLLLEELLRAGGADGETLAVPTSANLLGTMPVPAAIKELVARRLSRLSPVAQRLLQVAAVAGPEFDSETVAEAAGIGTDELIDALEETDAAGVVREAGSPTRYAFTHRLFREAIYAEILKSRRLRFHQRLAEVLVSRGAERSDRLLNQLAYHAAEAASIGDAGRAVEYSLAAGDRALASVAYEEAVAHFTRALDVLDSTGVDDPHRRCDVLLALGEAHNRAGDATAADRVFDEAVVVARAVGDPRRLARAVVRSGPLTYLGIIEARPELVALLGEVKELLVGVDEHLRAIVTARLAMTQVYAGAHERGLAEAEEAVALARAAGDPLPLAFAINARLHALWGIEQAERRVADSEELCILAARVHDDLLVLHGRMWRVRELVARGDVRGASHEVEHFLGRETGPRHPVTRSYVTSARAMFALMDGALDDGERLAAEALEMSASYWDLATSFYGAQMLWTWWQRDSLPALEEMFRSMLDQAPKGWPIVEAAMALLCGELGLVDEGRGRIEDLAAQGWDAIAADQTEGITMALVAAACETLGAAVPAAELAERLVPYSGTNMLVRPPGNACLGPADHYLGLVRATAGDPKGAVAAFESAEVLARRMGADPFVAAAQAELARALRGAGGRDASDRASRLARDASATAERMGLHRIARRAGEVLSG